MTPSVGKVKQLALAFTSRGATEIMDSMPCGRVNLTHVWHVFISWIIAMLLLVQYGKAYSQCTAAVSAAIYSTDID
jgi:hypothetical protein